VSEPHHPAVTLVLPTLDEALTRRGGWSSRRRSSPPSASTGTGRCNRSRCATTRSVATSGR
jgi:hypothetical protein